MENIMYSKIFKLSALSIMIVSFGLYGATFAPFRIATQNVLHTALNQHDARLVDTPYLDAVGMDIHMGWNGIPLKQGLLSGVEHLSLSLILPDCMRIRRILFLHHTHCNKSKPIVCCYNRLCHDWYRLYFAWHNFKIILQLTH